MTHYDVDEQHPYPGLYSFREQDRNYFFGRKREIKELAERIKSNVLTVVLGKSGIGKTSLLQAGLIPELRKEYYLPIYLRIRFDNDKESPIRQVKKTVEAKIKELDKTTPSFRDLTLWEYFHNLKIFGGYVKPLLFFDQFEEVFTAGKKYPGKIDPLITEIGDLVQNWVPVTVQEKYKDQRLPYGKRPNYRVIFSLREEYLPKLKNFSLYIPSIVNGRYHFRVVQIRKEDAVEAVWKPGKKVIASRDVAEEMVKKIPESKEADYSPYEEQKGYWKSEKIEPFLLSLFCFKINEKRLKIGGVISRELFAGVKAKDIIKDYFEENINSSLRKALEEQLLTEDGFRKLQDVNSFKKGGDVKDTDIEMLIRKRIIRRESRNNIDYIELIHDVLAPILKKSRDKRKEEEKHLKELEEKNRELRRNRNIIIFIMILLMVLGALTWYVYKQKTIAEKKARSAKSYELAAYSENSLDRDPTLSFRLAERAYAADHTNPNAYGALLNSYYHKKAAFYQAILKHNDNVNSAGFSPDGEYIITAGKDKIAKLWDLTGKKVREFKHDDIVRFASFSPGGEYLVTAGGVKTIRLWTLDGEPLKKFKTKNYVDFAVFSGNMKYIATVGVDKTVRYWDFDGNLVNKVSFVNKGITRGIISYKGRKVIIREDSRKTALLLDARGNVLMEFKGHKDYVNSAFFSPDGRYIVTASDDRTARLWRVNVGKWEEEVLPARAPPDFARAVSPEGRYIVKVTRRSNILYLRDKKTGREWKMEGHEKVVNAAAFSPSGEHILTASMDGTARLWDLKGNALRVFRGHKESVNSACFSPGEKHIVTASSDRTVRFWNLNGVQVFKFDEFNDIVNSASFSVDGKYIIIYPAHEPAQIRLVDPKEIIRIVNKQRVWQLDNEVKKTYRIN